MDARLCDFYDWTTRRRCEQPASWVTHRSSVGTGGRVRYYCDRHRPPRARALADSSDLTPERDAPKAPKKR